eukprot:Hpha_TRINITY_DN15802_c0_g1::TRINITY_DN15802_c0_g1_i1::g.188900::m.188900
MGEDVEASPEPSPVPSPRVSWSAQLRMLADGTPESCADHWSTDFVTASAAAVDLVGEFDWTADYLTTLEEEVSGGYGSTQAVEALEARADVFTGAAVTLAETAVRVAIAHASSERLKVVREPRRDDSGRLAFTYSSGRLLVHLSRDPTFATRAVRNARYLAALGMAGLSISVPPCCVVRCLGVRVLVCGLANLSKIVPCAAEERQALVDWLGTRSLHPAAALLWGRDGKQYWIPGELLPKETPRLEAIIASAGAEGGVKGNWSRYTGELSDEKSLLRAELGSVDVVPAELCESMHRRGLRLRMLGQFSGAVSGSFGDSLAEVVVPEMVARTAKAILLSEIVRLETGTRWGEVVLHAANDLLRILLSGTEDGEEQRSPSTSVGPVAAIVAKFEAEGSEVAGLWQSSELQHRAARRFGTLVGMELQGESFVGFLPAAVVDTGYIYPGRALSQLLPRAGAEPIMRRGILAAPAGLTVAFARMRFANFLFYQARGQRERALRKGTGFFTSEASPVELYTQAVRAVLAEVGDGMTSVSVASVLEAAGRWLAKQGMTEEATASLSGAVLSRRRMAGDAWRKLVLGQTAVELEAVSGGEASDVDALRMGFTALDNLLQSGELSPSLCFSQITQPLLLCLTEAEQAADFPDAAERAAHRLLSDSTEQLGSAAADTAEAAAMLGRVLQSQFKFKEATPLFEQYADTHVALANSAGSTTECAEALHALACFYVAHAQHIRRGGKRRRSSVSLFALQPVHGPARDLFVLANQLLQSVADLTRPPADGSSPAPKLHATALGGQGTVQQFLGDMGEAERSYKKALEALEGVEGAESEIREFTKGIEGLQRRKVAVSAIQLQRAGRGWAGRVALAVKRSRRGEEEKADAEDDLMAATVAQVAQEDVAEVVSEGSERVDTTAGETGVKGDETVAKEKEMAEGNKRATADATEKAAIAERSEKVGVEGNTEKGAREDATEMVKEAETEKAVTEEKAVEGGKEEPTEKAGREDAPDRETATEEGVKEGPVLSVAVKERKSPADGNEKMVNEGGTERVGEEGERDATEKESAAENAAKGTSEGQQDAGDDAMGVQDDKEEKKEEGVGVTKVVEDESSGAAKEETTEKAVEKSVSALLARGSESLLDLEVTLGELPRAASFEFDPVTRLAASIALPELDGDDPRDFGVLLALPDSDEDELSVEQRAAAEAAAAAAEAAAREEERKEEERREEQRKKKLAELEERQRREDEAALRIQKLHRARAARKEARRRRWARSAKGVAGREAAVRGKLESDCGRDVLYLHEVERRERLHTRSASELRRLLAVVELSRFSVKEGAWRRRISGIGEGMGDAMGRRLLMCVDEIERRGDIARKQEAERAVFNRAVRWARQEHSLVPGWLARSRTVCNTVRSAATSAACAVLVVTNVERAEICGVPLEHQWRWQELLRAPWRPAHRAGAASLTPQPLPGSQSRRWRAALRRAPATTPVEALAELRAGCTRPASVPGQRGREAEGEEDGSLPLMITVERAGPESGLGMLFSDVFTPISELNASLRAAQKRAFEGSLRIKRTDEERRQRAEEREQEQATAPLNAKAARRRAQQRAAGKQLHALRADTVRPSTGSPPRSRRPHSPQRLALSAVSGPSAAGQPSRTLRYRRYPMALDDRGLTGLGPVPQLPPANVFAGLARGDMHVACKEDKRRYAIVVQEEDERDTAVVDFLRKLSVLLAGVGKLRKVPGISDPGVGELEWAEERRRWHAEGIALEALQLIAEAAVVGATPDGEPLAKRILQRLQVGDFIPNQKPHPRPKSGGRETVIGLATPPFVIRRLKLKKVT